MWNISELKEKGKAAMKSNYGLCLVSSLIMSATAAGYSSTAGSNSKSISDQMSEDPQFVSIMMIVLAISSACCCEAH